MLNIFRSNKTTPNYRLVAPRDGELQTITVHEEVGCTGASPWLKLSTDALDIENTAICFWRGPTEHTLHPREI